MEKNMEQLYLSATALLVAGVFAACSSDDDAPMQEQPAPEAGSVTICATITDEPASRIALGGSDGTSTKVLWTNGDAFSLKVGETACTFTTALDAPSATANFTCENAPVLTADTTVTATYPANHPTSYAEQLGTEAGLSQYLTMTATATATTDSYEDLPLSFKHTTSVVKLTLTNEAFKSAQVTDITLAASDWSVKTTSTFTGSEEGSVTAYLVINFTDELTEATITATCGGAYYSTTLGGKTLTAGKLYKVTKTMTAFTPYFSVSAETKVQFAPGNLRYIQSTQKWSFAEHQYDVLFQSNITNPTYKNPVYVGTTLLRGESYNGEGLADMIDLFGWSGNENATDAQWGVSASKNRTDYSPNNSNAQFVDWGQNVIDDYPANTWRTLSMEEWMYLFRTRTNAETLFAYANLKINDEMTVKGLILLPDNWILPEELDFVPATKNGLVWTEGPYNIFYKNSTSGVNYTNATTYTEEEWEELEKAGAVFFPVTGRRGYIDNILNVGELEQGRYWTGTTGDNEYNKWAFSGSVN